MAQTVLAASIPTYTIGFVLSCSMMAIWCRSYTCCGTSEGMNMDITKSMFGKASTSRTPWTTSSNMGSRLCLLSRS